MPTGEETAQQVPVIVATEIDRLETEKIKRILREDYNQYESTTEERKKKRIIGQL